MRDAPALRVDNHQSRNFNESQLAQRWDVAETTLRKWRTMGIGPVYLKLGAAVRYRFEDVERYRDVLHYRGWQYERELHYERVEGGEHNEASWAQRVAPFLRFLFPAS